MATFPSINPSYNSQKTTSPQIRTTQFNDGYQHRIKFGLNTKPYVFNLTFGGCLLTFCVAIIRLFKLVIAL